VSASGSLAVASETLSAKFYPWLKPLATPLQSECN